MAVREACDQPVQAQAAQVVGHAARGHGAGIQPQQQSETLADILVGKPLRPQTKQDQHAQQRLHARIGERQSGDTLAAHDLRLCDLPKSVLADLAIVAECLDVEQTSIGPKADLFFFNDTATTEIYTLSLHDALPISVGERERERWSRHGDAAGRARTVARDRKSTRLNSSHVEISYAVFCLKKKK